MTMELNYKVRPKTIQKNFIIKSVNKIEELDKHTFKFEFPNLDTEYEYENCFSVSSKRFHYCDLNKSETVTLIPVVSDADFYILSKKGFIYFDKDYAFIHSNLKRNFYDDSRGQFGFPKAVAISNDGLSRLITYHKPRIDLNDVCYHEQYNSNSDRFEFKEDCVKVSNKIKFHPMQKVKLQKAIYLNIIEDGYFDRKKVRFIAANYKTTLWIIIENIEGKKIENPNVLLYLLYPASILFDIITFPIQIFVVPFGKTALG